MGAKKIRRGKYEYRGYYLYNCGYHQPDHRVWWEARDPETQSAEFHAETKRRIMQMIDEDLEKSREAEGEV